MTTGIRTLLQEYLIKHGKPGKAKLCKAVKKSEITFDRWMRNGIPDAHDAFRLLREIGLKESEALRLAREEALPAEAKEPA